MYKTQLKLEKDTGNVVPPEYYPTIDEAINRGHTWFMEYAWPFDAPNLLVYHQQNYVCITQDGCPFYVIVRLPEHVDLTTLLKTVEPLAEKHNMGVYS